MVGRVWTFFVLGEGDFFAGQTVKLWHFDEDFRWLKPRLQAPNGRCAMRIFKTTTNLNLQHASAKPFMMIAECILTNQEKILQKLNRFPSPYIKYTFWSLMFWFVKKIKPESSMSKIHPISLLVLLPIIHSDVCSCFFPKKKWRENPLRGLHRLHSWRNRWAWNLHLPTGNFTRPSVSCYGGL